ncbi:2-C-methyl-D-erythritol 2,4-cyclodiphosphate synthase [uncultured Vagococcus sp.]|uniref:2-C-methyl-D-erythritol 2,4-cyclodiphosphate synthase n=1 Tax=uncultured Vagococcus sp. TaxID=189676 RepID=UPI0028D2C547|nr:2-C-methyl-D-erythritol 2,4-cyclodiphosphate synthase [uncultured Vagococcus sp.]
MRIGQGFDVHQLVSGRPLMIGGVNIPYGKGLLGHSDADVLLHAITDALLGAAGLADIGHLFPDTDDDFKDADSVVLLSKAWQEISRAGFTIGNLDCTILAEKPKMQPYLPEMKSRIAQACGCDISQVNVKATTMETMGFVGQEEGIGALAVALLVITK